MQNPVHSFPHNSPSLLNSFPSTEQDMEDHFNHLLGESTSRYTAAQTQIATITNEEAFHSNRMFIIGTLESWGMKVGTLPYSKDNEITVKCLLELISEKQRNLQQKIKAKEQLAAVNFEKQKIQSFLKQSKNSLLQTDKLLGKIENQSTELKKKIRLIETQAKKEKAEDQRIIFMLKSKNQQILHQIKKKQAQLNRVKQQMKRNVLSKSTSSAKTQNSLNPASNTLKNSFDIIQKIQRKNPSRWKKNITQRNTDPNYGQNFDEEKCTFMLQKYENEKKIIMNENTLLRGKFFDIREVLLKFSEWIDVELFGQTLEKTKKMLEKKFICNHNLLFSKDALMSDLMEVISEAKHGIQQLQQRLQQTERQVSSQKSLESPLKKNNKTNGNGQSLKIINREGIVLFKKKSVSIRGTGTPAKSSESQKQTKNQHQPKQNQLQAQKGMNRPHQMRSPQVQKQFIRGLQYGGQSLPSQIRPSKSSFINQLQLSAFDNDVLSDIYEHSVTEDGDNSIVSHISASEFVRELETNKKDKYDKWDILFRTQGDEEE